MGATRSKRDSKGQLTVCPKCEKAVRGAKGLKAHEAACAGKPASKKRAA